MRSDQDSKTATPLRDFLAGGGEMGRLIRDHDWTESVCGWPHEWSQPLRTVVSLVLSSTQPMAVLWGEHGICIYNDAFSQSLGPRQHPGSLAQPAREVWKDIWHMIGSDFEQVLTGTGSIRQINRTIPTTRHGQQENIQWIYDFTPVDDLSAPYGLGGVLVICNEVSDLAYANQMLGVKCEQLTQMFNKASTFMALMSGPNHRFELSNPSHDQVVGHRPILGRFVSEALPDAKEQGFVRILDRVFATGEPYTADRARYRIQADPDRPAKERILNFVYRPVFGADDQVSAIFAEGIDVTDQVQTQEELERVNNELADTLRRLKAIEQRKSFRLKLTDRLRTLVDANEIAAAATELLGRFLGVTRVFYGDFTKAGDAVIIRPGWTTEGADSMAGAEIRLEDFGP